MDLTKCITMLKKVVRNHKQGRDTGLMLFILQFASFICCKDHNCPVKIKGNPPLW